MLYAALMHLAAAVPDAEPRSEGGAGRPIPADKTEIVFVGTIHSWHDQNPHYGPQVLEDILTRLRPAAICVELDSYYFLPDGSLDRWVVETPELVAAAPETVVIDKACSALGILALPFDIEGRQDFFRESRYFERQQEISERIDMWCEELAREDPGAEVLALRGMVADLIAASYAMVLRGSPATINSDAFDKVDAVLNMLHDRADAILSQHPELWNEVAESHRIISDYNKERDRTMARNLARIAGGYRGKRIVACAGASHRRARKYLVDDNSVVLREFWEVLG